MFAWQTFCLAVALAAAPIQIMQPQGDRPFDLSLVDQFGKHRAVSDCWGDLLVLVYGDKQVENADRQLRDRLDARFHRVSHGAGEAAVKPVAGAPAGVRSPDVRLAAVACLQGVPPNMVFITQRHFAATSPHGMVLLDMQDRMKQAFGLTTGVTHVVVFDTHGRLRLRTAGEFDEESFGRLVDAIEALRVEAVEAHLPKANASPPP